MIIVDRSRARCAGWRAPAARDRDRALGERRSSRSSIPTSIRDRIGRRCASASTVGAQTRSLGGLGAYESVTVRGASAGHTEVLIDGVPLARIAAVTTDLGRFAARLVRRGRAVSRRGAGRARRRWRRRCAESDHAFGARRARRALAARRSARARSARVTCAIHYGDRPRRRALSSTTIGYQGATGDYTYYNDNGTPLNPTDDRTRFATTTASIRSTARRASARRPARSVGGLRESCEGAGLAGQSTDRAFVRRLAGTLDVVGDARGRRRGRQRHRARELGYLLVEDQQLHDPLGELGLGIQQRAYVTMSGGASSTWSVPFGPHRGTAGIELRADRFRDEDVTGVEPT